MDTDIIEPTFATPRLAMALRRHVHVEELGVRSPGRRQRERPLDELILPKAHRIASTAIETVADPSASHNVH